MYRRFLSKRAHSIKPSPIRMLTPLLKIPGMISLGAGYPNPSMFPISSLNVTLKDGSEINFNEEITKEMLQYCPSFGLPSFIKWAKHHMATRHTPKLQDTAWNVCITNGSQEALFKSLDILIDPGDSILTENPTYSGALCCFHLVGARSFGVPTDHHGLIPDRLSDILNQWETTHPSIPKPKLLYTVPTGQNPSGATLTLQRKESIYRIAKEHDLLILEDDPYWHLKLLPDLEPELKSFFNLDEDGRVLRFDSLSKVLSSGLRLGWVTGPTELIELIQLHNQSSSIHSSGLSQGIAAQIFEHWGEEGFNAQVQKVQEFYTKRRDIFLHFCDKYLKGLAEWNTPSAGMFIWFKLNGVEDSLSLVKEKAVNSKVLLLPGQSFTPDDQKSPYVRASYSTASPEEMEEAVKRLASLLQNPN
eukprot:TRINITY_DN3526_c0_g1_i1.p1 TRINITY_DN3526_c0_g1~~TRINITY_DN3526_c0_g1_i1.p1  ORF type:complete len:417 (+),score=61.33 TRINITY_DN3526_c0_g1_i1:54-1304(+)